MEPLRFDRIYRILFCVSKCKYQFICSGVDVKLHGSRHKRRLYEKAIITVVGKDTVGIIAKVCTFLSEKNINILDISQTITGGFFNMMMIVDVSNSTESFDTVVAEIVQYGRDQIGVDIKMQLEEIFTMMHRI